VDIASLCKPTEKVIFSALITAQFLVKVTDALHATHFACLCSALCLKQITEIRERNETSNDNCAPKYLHGNSTMEWSSKNRIEESNSGVERDKVGASISTYTKAKTESSHGPGQKEKPKGQKESN
jgi:hypothetical protein